MGKAGIRQPDCLLQVCAQCLLPALLTNSRTCENPQPVTFPPRASTYILLTDVWLSERREAAFVSFRLRVAQALSEDRGRASRLARFLGVSRQRISQWFTLAELPAVRRLVPGWVVLPTLEFLDRENIFADVRHPQSPNTAETPRFVESPRAGATFDRVEQLEARLAHNQKVGGSSPSPVPNIREAAHVALSAFGALSLPLGCGGKSPGVHGAPGDSRNCQLEFPL